jgi:hypothetical protein
VNSYENGVLKLLLELKNIDPDLMNFYDKVIKRDRIARQPLPPLCSFARQHGRA